jgi:hypothetical protein
MKGAFFARPSLELALYHVLISRTCSICTAIAYTALKGDAFEEYFMFVWQTSRAHSALRNFPAPLSTSPGSRTR